MRGYLLLSFITLETRMSAPHDDRPRYTPAKPTPEQLRAMHEALGRLSGAYDETEGQASAPAEHDDQP